MQHGRKPTLEEVAEEAMVSRATAYRYLASVEALVVEASLDLAIPSPAQLFENDASEDPVARLDRVDSALHAMIRANEASLRLILMNSLQRAGNGDVPPRQNRRTPGARPIQTCGIEESRPGPGTYHRHRGDGGVQGRTAAGRG
jgi:AcrR family transcriptional regulator